MSLNPALLPASDPPPVTLTRVYLTRLIEQALTATASLTDQQREAIREAAKVTTRVARGDWYVNRYECGCPAFQAGLATRQGRCDSPGVMAFAEHFDRITREANLAVGAIAVNPHT